MRHGRTLCATITGILLVAVGCSSTVGGNGTVSTRASSPAPHTSGPSTPAPASTNPTNPYTRPELPAAAAISGIRYHPEPDHLHVLGVVRYDTTPPTGGNHSAYWADCSGTVYPQAIANENAVHMLEHGAVWITYRDGLDSAGVAALRRLVVGHDYTAMSPYPRLSSAVSVQSWDYQLFVDDPTDPRIAQFVTLLRRNPSTTPEAGGPCSQPAFKAHPGSFGHPLQHP